ncbi:hypothetical protein QJS04_geneDACA024400 [Acorus gramineus]|uniref:Uncharacterized protein n=1 Tax=Acorus gramineus TaxID=55184 RepID=A0AAV9ASQ9_ACOGR|nr:hypothetical protein QJS04_geneDACA024400 [Acorus gramineus]
MAHPYWSSERYVRLFMGNSHKVKWKEEMLSLVKDDRNESLSAAKKEYRGAILSDSLRKAHPYLQRVPKTYKHEKIKPPLSGHKPSNKEKPGMRVEEISTQS